MGRTPVISANLSVSSESVGMPDAQPLRLRDCRNQLNGRHLNGIARRSHHHQRAVRSQAVNQRRHRFELGA